MRRFWFSLSFWRVMAFVEILQEDGPVSCKEGGKHIAGFIICAATVRLHAEAARGLGIKRSTPPRHAIRSRKPFWWLVAVRVHGSMVVAQNVAVMHVSSGFPQQRNLAFQLPRQGFETSSCRAWNLPGLVTACACPNLFRHLSPTPSQKLYG